MGVYPAFCEHSQEPKRFSIKTITLIKSCITQVLARTQKIFYENNYTEWALHLVNIHRNPKDLVLKQLHWVNSVFCEHSQEPKRFTMKRIALNKSCISWINTWTHKIYIVLIIRWQLVCSFVCKFWQFFLVLRWDITINNMKSYNWLLHGWNKHNISELMSTVYSNDTN